MVRKLTLLRAFALCASLLATSPASAAWSGDCAPPSNEPQLAGLGAIVSSAFDSLPASRVEDRAGRRVTKSSAHHDVPGIEQQGPTCGIYAATMVIAHYSGLSRSLAERTAKVMLRSAKERKLTTRGEMSLESLEKLVEDAGFPSRVRKDATFDDVVRAIENGRPPIVGIVVGADGNPAPVDREGGGHLAVVESVHTDEDGKRWLVVQHGWSREPYVWSEEEFVASWKLRGSQMMEIKRPTNDDHVRASR